MAIRIKGSKTTDAAAAAWAALLGKGNPEPIKNLIKNESDQFVKALPGDLKAVHDAIASLFGTVATKFSDVIEKDLDGLGFITPGDAETTFSKLMGDAFEFGVGAHLIALSMELLHPVKHVGLPALAALAAEFSGFKELVAAYHGSLVRQAITIPSSAAHAKKFRARPIGDRDAAQLAARRLLSAADTTSAIEWSGLMPRYEAALKAAAYRPLQPRMFATLLQDVPFPYDTVKESLEFAGHRDSDIALLLPLLETASQKNVRAQYLSAVTSAAERGTLTAAEVDSALTDLNFSDPAKHWVQLTIATRKLEQLAELYRKSISEDYKYNLITEAQYVPSLEAIGIAAADANAHFAVDSAVKHGRDLAAAAREAAREAAAVTRAQVKAALANYQEHKIDDLALAAALAVAGLPASIIPWAVDIAALRRQASLRMVFGKLVTPNDAVLLHEQVAAIKEQVIKKLVDIASARAALESFGVPPTNAQDLVATWAAQALKTILPIQ